MMGARLIPRLKRFARAEDGASLVEFGLVLPLFLLLAFGIIDFGRLGFSYVMAQKATEQAIREAVVRNPVCPGVPLANLRGRTDVEAEQIRYGASCQILDGLCADPGTMSCLASDGTTGQDIFAKIVPMLPTNATEANLRFSYAYDPNLGFLGGPYVPLVTVEIVDLDFEYVTPIGALTSIVTQGDRTDIGAKFRFPTMSTSLPAEALKDGEDA